jgi:hypothetical protein
MKQCLNCHKYFSETTNGYIMYSNVGSKLETAHDNSSQLTSDSVLSIHGKSSSRMCREFEAYAGNIASCI